MNAPFRLLLPLFLLLLLAPRVEARSPVLEGIVVRVYDGDTLEVRGAGKVRLLGIDTPEREPSQRDRFYRQWKVPPKHLRRIAREARTFTIRTVEGKRVRLDVESKRRDRHGRLLAYVVLPDGRTLNRLLLDEGYAVVYRRFDFGRKGEFMDAEERARTAGRGMWDKRGAFHFRLPGLHYAHCIRTEANHG